MAQYIVPFGGLRILVEQANRLKDRGHEVEIWSINPNIIRDIFPTKVRVISIPTEYDFEAQKILRINPVAAGAIDPEIVVVTGYQVLPPHHAFPDAKIFWYFQHDEMYWGSSIASEKNFQESLSRPIRFLSNSTWTRDVLRQKYKKESTLIPCGIDRNLFHPSKTPFYHLANPSLVFFWNDMEWKGSADLLIALNKVFQEFPSLHVIAISATTPTHFSGRNIVFHIQPRQEDLRHLYSSASVVVSPSWLEGFGLPGLEAMACGVPLVTTDSGGVRDYAVNGENCLMIKPRDPSALATAIIRVLKDESLRKKLIEKGLETAARFGWEDIIDRLEKVLRG